MPKSADDFSHMSKSPNQKSQPKMLVLTTTTNTSPTTNTTTSTTTLNVCLYAVLSLDFFSCKILEVPVVTTKSRFSCQINPMQLTV